jgi:hypothetical protein
MGGATHALQPSLSLDAIRVKKKTIFSVVFSEFRVRFIYLFTRAQKSLGEEIEKTAFSEPSHHFSILFASCNLIVFKHFILTCRPVL